MTFSYSIIITKTIQEPNRDKQVDYVYLTNNYRFVQEKMMSKDSTNIIHKSFRGKQWIQFKNGGWHYDTVMYNEATSIRDTKKVFPSENGLLFSKTVKMTSSEMHEMSPRGVMLDI